jgi:hypothetical protein
MENNFYTDNFEQLLREKTENYKMYPSDAVWKNIHHRLHNNNKQRWILLLLLISISAGMGYWAGTMNASQHINASANKASLRSNNNDKNTIQSAARQPISDNSIPHHSVSKANMLSVSALIDRNAGYNSYYNHTTYQHVYTKRNNYKRYSRKSENSINNTVILSNQENDYNDNNANNYTSARFVSDNMISQKDDNNHLSAEALGAGMSAGAIAQKETNNTTAEKQSLNLTTNELAWQPIKLPVRKNKSKWGMNYYATANSSYRKLMDEGVKYTNSPSIQVPAGTSMDANNIVSHKPSLGFEGGVGITYQLSEGTWFKTGLQFNYNRYYINAFTYNLERAVIIDDPNNTVTSYSTYRSISGYRPATLENNNFQVSLPIGLDFRIAGNPSFQWYAGASIQPTYNLAFNTFLLSADKKNYVSANDFLRRWNFNAAFETGLSFGFRNGMSLQLAPQFRYQLKPSYIDPYTIKEFLLEYGFKVGIRNPFRR